MSKIKESNIKCPSCGTEIGLSEAMAHGLKEKLNVELDARLKAERLRITADAEKSAETKMGSRLKELESQSKEHKKIISGARKNELAFLKEKRRLEESRENLELDVARKLDAERQKIVSKALQQAVEAERLKLSDKYQLIGGLQKQINELKQSAEQGSMQLQGETLEVQLEEELREAFRHDDVTEIKKGQLGADVLQMIRTNQGVECGKILWEAKRAKNWSKSWVEKLRKDQREAGAELAVLVTTSPPDGLRGFDHIDGIWICEPIFAVATAKALRQGLIETTMQRAQVSGRKDKMALLYDHLCSVEFRQNVDGLVEVFKALQDQLVAEQRAFQKQWKEREKRIKMAVQHTASIYGDIQGIAGREALPEIKTLELPGGSGPEAIRIAG